MTCMIVHSSPHATTLAFALIVAGTACAEEARVLPRGGHAIAADIAVLDRPLPPRGGHALGADMAALDAAAVPPPAAKGAAAGRTPAATAVAVTK